jgi:FixJ family two-component response regulator
MKSAEQSPHMEIFLLDDDPGVRGTLRITLGNVGYKVVCFANDRALFKAIRQRTPACIILDAGLRGRSGIETLKYLTGYPAPVIMVSWHEDIPTAVNAIKCGAVDFIQKPFRGDEIIGRLEDALKGGAPEAKCNQRASPKAEPSSLNFPRWETLTRREREVLEQIAAGLSNKDAGRVLGISHRTIEVHRTKLLRKLGVRNSTELLVSALKRNRQLTKG